MGLYNKKVIVLGVSNFVSRLALIAFVTIALTKLSLVLGVGFVIAAFVNELSSFFIKQELNKIQDQLVGDYLNQLKQPEVEFNDNKWN